MRGVKPTSAVACRRCARQRSQPAIQVSSASVARSTGARAAGRGPGGGRHAAPGCTGGGRGVRGGEHGVGVLDERQPGVRELDAAAEPGEQGGADLVLEAGDVVRDGGLRVAERAGRRGQRALAGDGAQHLHASASGTLRRMPSAARLPLLYLLVIAIWGTTWIAIRSAVDSVPPITASGLRFAIAFPILAAIVARTRSVPLRNPADHARLFALVTVAYFAVPFALMNLGGAAIPSGLSAVLFSMVSIFILALSVPGLGTRISRRQVTGVGAALAALAALIAHQTGIGGAASPLGILALLAAAALHAAVYVTILVFILFPAVAQLAAILGGEGAMDGPSLALLALVLGFAATALTGGGQLRRVRPALRAAPAAAA